VAANACLILFVAVPVRRLYSLTEAGWNTVATLQVRRAGATVLPGSSDTVEQIPSLTAAHASGGDNSSGAATAAQVVSAPNSQTACAGGVGGNDLIDVGAALIERTISAALAHIPQQSHGPVWDTDAADDPGWVRTDFPATVTRIQLHETH
jgi:hypothetical protein